MSPSCMKQKELLLVLSLIITFVTLRGLNKRFNDKTLYSFGKFIIFLLLQDDVMCLAVIGGQIFSGSYDGCIKVSTMI